MKNNITNIESNNEPFLTAKSAGFLVGKKGKQIKKEEVIQNTEVTENASTNEVVNADTNTNNVQEPVQIFNAPLCNDPLVETSTNTESTQVFTDNQVIVTSEFPEIKTNSQENQEITEENSVTENSKVTTEATVENTEVQDITSTAENTITENNDVSTVAVVENNGVQDITSTAENTVIENNDVSTVAVVENNGVQDITSTAENTVIENNEVSTEVAVESNEAQLNNENINLNDKHTIDEFEEAENEFAVAPIATSTPQVEENNSIEVKEDVQEAMINSNPSSIFNIPLITVTPVQENSETTNNESNSQEKTSDEQSQETHENDNINKENEDKSPTTVAAVAPTAGLNSNIDYFNFEFKTSQPEKEEIKTELSLDEDAMQFDFNSVIREPENKGTLDTPTEKIVLDKFLEPKENLIKKAEEAEENDNNVIRIKEDSNEKSQNGRKYLLYGFYVLLLVVAIFFCIKVYKNSTNFSLTRTEITLAINSTYQAEIVANSKIQDNKKYQWSSSNTAIVTVDENGLITSVGDGEATIFVEKGSNKKELKVTAVAIEITSITFKETELSLKVGEEKTLQAIINDDETIVIDLVWESSNPDVVTVDENGHVIAVGEGTASIQVYDDVSGKASELLVTVTPSKDGQKPEEKPEESDKDKETVEVTKVALNKSDLIMEVDEYVVVSAVVRPANATDKKVTWSSSNKKVATVSSSGKITAKAEGTATITATTSNGKKASLKVTVTKKFINVTGVSLNKESATLDVGASLTLKATVAPSNATNPKVTWSTSDSSVATVSGGKVTAKAPGTATITVTTNDGNKKAVCNITVKEKEIIKVTGITLSDESISLETGSSKTITATVAPDNATDKTLTWSTSDSSVATVSDGKITAKGAGTATITATSSDGSKSATCTVKVTDPVIEATGVSLNSKQITLKVGETYQLKATITPSNTSDKTLTWTSSKKSYATVDENGLVTALKAGNAIITVKTENGKKATCAVTIEEAETTTPEPEPEPTPES